MQSEEPGLTQTALAESELEYPEGHVSPSIYVAFPIENLGNVSAEIALRADLKVHRLADNACRLERPYRACLLINPCCTS